MILNFFGERKNCHWWENRKIHWSLDFIKKKKQKKNEKFTSKQCFFILTCVDFLFIRWEKGKLLEKSTNRQHICENFVYSLKLCFFFYLLWLVEKRKDKGFFTMRNLHKNLIGISAAIISFIISLPLPPPPLQSHSYLENVFRMCSVLECPETHPNIRCCYPDPF